MAYQDFRVLLGWMDQDEAVAQLLGHLPQPGEDISECIERWTRARLKVLKKAEYARVTPEILPLIPQLQPRGRNFLARGDVQSAFCGWDYTVGVVDLRNILSFQKTVAADAVHRVDDLDLEDPEVLFDLCLPNPSNSSTLAATADLDQKGISFSSPNPNLRIVAGRGALIDGVPFYGFAVGYGLPFLQVVEYEGRWFVRDGYHRSFALLQHGITHVPCLFIRAANVLQFGGIAPQFFLWDVLFGSRPPFLTDFLDEEAAATVRKTTTGKIIRIVAQEFSVQM